MRYYQGMWKGDTKVNATPSTQFHVIYVDFPQSSLFLVMSIPEESLLGIVIFLHSWHEFSRQLPLHYLC